MALMKKKKVVKKKAEEVEEVKAKVEAPAPKASVKEEKKGEEVKRVILKKKEVTTKFPQPGTNNQKTVIHE